MNAVVKSHRSGSDVVPCSMVVEIQEALSKVDISLRKYVIKEFRSSFPTRLKELGWSDAVSLDSVSKISITSVRNNVGLCMQTGNVSRVYADLLKLQALYMRGSITSGIILLPTATAARAFGGNVASLERLMRELRVFNQVITAPLVIIGFYD